ncbi:carbohydrate ABC transporter permease [Alkalihalobacillus trypoxylicola]|uniref:ABC transporter permease n=1 Tax=Alkalihalobacillus trypoxylicola TaxID=519424 RepID=A0A161P8E9_9BACI|nr:carbohydrate ABC transporter permease [Alkalihalobacillus trypoxylicola]KYG26968.1 ABC transporter permease [Alkalihalobacillus trypoxylicola]GAF66598.1 ABC transporter permease protein [Bacillus sp. TS-2]
MPLARLFTFENLKRWTWNFVRFVLIAGLSFVILYPILQKVSTAIKHKSDLYSPIVVWIPQNLTLDNFRDAIAIMNYWETLLNTFALSGMTTILTTASCALAGYAFARLKFKGSKILFAGVILTILVPPTTILIPMFMNLREFSMLGIIPLLTGDTINLLDSYWPFILTSITANSLKSGLYIFIFTQFFRGIPKAIEEAAYIDGAGVGTTFFRIMLPNAFPAIVTVVLFSFVWQWNDSFYTTTYLTSSNVMSTQLSSLPYNLAMFLDSGDAAQADPFYLSMVQDTGILLAIMPLIIIYLFVQRYFVQSVERTGIVG